MSSLPSYEHKNQRLELAAFLSLGLAGLWLAGAAFHQATSFACQRDEIVATLSGGPVLAACCKTNHALTNLTAVPAAGPCAHTESAPARSRAS